MTPFWKKPLAQMTKAEWESLCDGCGWCCMVQLRDIDGYVFTDVSCRLFKADTCRCRDYSHRTTRVPDCIRITPRNVRRLKLLPSTCAYRLVAEGRDLYWWHHLVSGDHETIHQAGMSVRDIVSASETDVKGTSLDDHIICLSKSGQDGRTSRI